MNDSLATSLVTVLMGVIGVAVIATLVSKKAQTPQVLSAGGSAFSNVLNAALSPITGGSFTGGMSSGSMLG